jgi:hypothetical protein
MDRSIAKAILESQDAAAGLQLFDDGIRQRDARAHISECIRELLMLIRGFEDLRRGVENLSRLPSQMESDIWLLVRSLRFSLAGLEHMFGETANTKLNGDIPYAHIWHEYCKELQKTEDGVMLLPRLELYSVFLKAVLQWLAG